MIAPKGISSGDYLRTLVPELHREKWQLLSGDLEAELRAFEQFLNASRDDRQAYDALFAPQEYKETGRAPRWIDPMRTLARVISLRSKNRIVFVTDTNMVGLCAHEDPITGIKEGDVLVGLFGINFPFILRRNPDEAERHSLIGIASVANHEWGHDFLGNTFKHIDERLANPYDGPEVKFEADVTWKDFEKHGLTEITII